MPTWVDFSTPNEFTIETWDDSLVGDYADFLMTGSVDGTAVTNTENNFLIRVLDPCPTSRL